MCSGVSVCIALQLTEPSAGFMVLAVLPFSASSNLPLMKHCQGIFTVMLLTSLVAWKPNRDSGITLHVKDKLQIQLCLINTCICVYVSYKRLKIQVESEWETVCFSSSSIVTTFQIKLYLSCAEYKCRLYREMLTYKPLTNSTVQEEKKHIYQVTQ